jgi:hypothetical protein
MTRREVITKAITRQLSWVPGCRDSGNQRPPYATAAAQGRTLGRVGGDGSTRRPTLGC